MVRFGIVGRQRHRVRGVIIDARKGGAPGSRWPLPCSVVLPQARIPEEILKGENWAVVTSSRTQGWLVTLRFWINKIHKAGIVLVSLEDFGHIPLSLRPVQDILGDPAHGDNTHTAPGL